MLPRLLAQKVLGVYVYTACSSSRCCWQEVTSIYRQTGHLWQHTHLHTYRKKDFEDAQSHRKSNIQNKGRNIVSSASSFNQTLLGVITALPKMQIHRATMSWYSLHINRLTGQCLKVVYSNAKMPFNYQIAENSITSIWFCVDECSAIWIHEMVRAFFFFLHLIKYNSLIIKIITIKKMLNFCILLNI